MTNATQNNLEKIIVIGGGISGLAAAALLAKAGWNVTLLEKNSTLGGRARTLDISGFHFDMGPSWYLMPEVFERFFEIFNKKTSDYYHLQKLDPRYQVFFDDDSKYIFTDNLTQNNALFEDIEKGAGIKLGEYLAETKEVYQDFTKRLMFEDPWNFKILLNPSNLLTLLTLIPRFRLFFSWHRYVTSFFHDHRLQKILTFPAVFLGGSPYNTPALYSILNWADFGRGVWYPIGGLGKVVSALENLAKEKGVKIVTSADVSSIQVSNGEVIGVMVKEHFYPASKVVAATDIPYVQTKLLPKSYSRRFEKSWQKKSLGISAVLIYLGVNKKIRHKVHHSLYFGQDWEKSFDQIIKKKVLPEDPSFYISIRTATDPSIAPQGCEEIFVLVPIGARTDYDSQKLSLFTDQVIDKMEKLLKISIKDSIVVKQLYTPTNFESDYHAYQGAALGLAHTLKQSLWFRPRNVDDQIRGLYYAGQYTNPGVGVPMALISAQIVAKAIGMTPNQNASIFKKGSVTYYYSSLFFTGQIKQDVFTFYAYVRVIDDFVDAVVPELGPFESMWEDTLTCWAGKSVQNKIVNNFIELAKRKRFEWKWIEAFWIAMRSDLTKKKYLNMTELYTYTYGSAEVIGLMMARILGLSEQSFETAALMGRSMQYLNFIRDVKEDDDLGRNYLGYEPEDVKSPVKWNFFIREHLDRLALLQQQAEKGYHFIPKKNLIPIKTAVDLYLWTAKRIYEDPSVVWKKKIKPSVFRVLYYIIKNTVILR